jgi:hypothetical protein
MRKPLALLFSLAALSAMPASAITPLDISMHIIAPAQQGDTFDNSFQAGAQLEGRIFDKDRVVTAGLYKSQILMTDAKTNWTVQAWAHGNLIATYVSSGSGLYSATLNFTNELNGPLPVEFRAIPPAGYPYKFATRLTLMVQGGKDYVYPNPAAVAKHGLHYTWSDNFSKGLNASPCKVGSGVWPNCTKPTAADHFLYWENKPGGSDFGNAANEHTDSIYGYNPFAVLVAGQTSMLAITTAYRTGYIDPYGPAPLGWKRVFTTGYLSTAFNDWTTNVPNSPKGVSYFETRVLLPNCQSDPNDKFYAGSGGCWPSLSLYSLNISTGGGLELDVFEYRGGIDQKSMTAGCHNYGNATAGSGVACNYYGKPVSKDLSWEPHRIGTYIDYLGANNGGVPVIEQWFDDVLIASGSPPHLAGKVMTDFDMDITTALGSGWPTNPPASGAPWKTYWFSLAKWIL